MATCGSHPHLAVELPADSPGDSGGAWASSLTSVLVPASMERMWLRARHNFAGVSVRPLRAAAKIKRLTLEGRAAAAAEPTFLPGEDSLRTQRPCQSIASATLLRGGLQVDAAFFLCFAPSDFPQISRPPSLYPDSISAPPLLNCLCTSALLSLKSPLAG